MPCIPGTKATLAVINQHEVVTLRNSISESVARTNGEDWGPSHEPNAILQLADWVVHIIDDGEISKAAARRHGNCLSEQMDALLNSFGTRLKSALVGPRPRKSRTVRKLNPKKNQGGPKDSLNLDRQTHSKSSSRGNKEGA